MSADNRRSVTLLDLFCGGGGAAVGYHRAGFDVVGVDVMAQPEYPFTFHQADAMTFDLDGFDAVHASPPCQAFSSARTIPRIDSQLSFGWAAHGDLLTPTLDRFAWLGVPWVVENVPGAPMPDGAALYCGSSFGLPVRRHRLFASNVHLLALPCRHHVQQSPVPMVIGHGGGTVRGQPVLRGAAAAAALGITHTVRQSVLSQAIPPAYTEHIGHQVMHVVRALPRGVGTVSADNRAFVPSLCHAGTVGSVADSHDGLIFLARDRIDDPVLATLVRRLDIAREAYDEPCDYRAVALALIRAHIGDFEDPAGDDELGEHSTRDR